jgi:hypothetical protein
VTDGVVIEAAGGNTGRFGEAGVAGRHLVVETSELHGDQAA